MKNINLEMLGSFIYTDKTKNEIDLFKKTFDKYLSASMVIPAGTQGGRFTKDIKKFLRQLIIRRNLMKFHPVVFFGIE